MNSRIKVLTIIGTRPESIKMAPVISALNSSAYIENTTCLSGQHPTMARDALELFDISADVKIDAINSSGDLSLGLSELCRNLGNVCKKIKPDWVFVHGDTMTTAAGALAAFHNQTRLAHIEAGLRTGNLHSPWPEEGYRRMVSPLTDLHFAPTQSASNNLCAEGVEADKIIVTGNTVVDALFSIRKSTQDNPVVLLETLNWFLNLTSHRRPILVTTHRRENHGEGLGQIIEAVRVLADKFPEHCFILPVHPNPAVSAHVRDRLSMVENVCLTEPLDYHRFVFAMERAELILTDSGGIQEEAPSFGTPVLVMRDHTERTEAIQAGVAHLVGSQTEKIVANACKIIASSQHENSKTHPVNPFGDGHAAEKIVHALLQYSQSVGQQLPMASIA